MNRSLWIGNWFGVPVYLHWTWILCFLLILAVSLKAAAIILGLFFIVVLHEFGHIFAGRYFGMETKDVTLLPIGGVARMNIPEQPIPEIIVSLGGPFVNLLLIPALLLLMSVAGSMTDFVFTLFTINLVLLVFNMIPSFPMDGGRVFRALLCMCLDNRLQATFWATRISQVICLFFIGYGVLNFHVGLLVIGVFIMMISQGEYEQVKVRSMFSDEEWDSADSMDDLINILKEKAEREKEMLADFRAMDAIDATSSEA